MNSSEYYLERVGFEANVRLRLNLKNGTNSIGRTNSKEKNDFGIDSMRCSALHCVVTVSGDSVEIVNKSLTVGTTVNGVKISNETMRLHENDIIGIVRGTSVPWNLAGNYNLYVYRLCKYSDENLLTIEIDDDETYEISDDDDDTNADDEVIILDRVDIKVEQDLCIQLTRDFNEEIKKELLDFDELEMHCNKMKIEASNFFDIETIDNDMNDAVDVATTFDPHRTENHDISCEVLRRESNDSNDTIIFSPTHQGNDYQSAENVTMNVGDELTLSQLECALAKVVHQEEDVHSVAKSQSLSNVTFTVEDGPERNKDEVVDTSKRKKASVRNESKAGEKRLKKAENLKENGKIIANTESSIKEKRKRKSNSTSTLKPQKSCEATEKGKTTAKVKYTKDNRGAFLTDPTQMPGLPVSVKERRKSTLITPAPTSLTLPNKESEMNDTEINDLVPELSLQIEKDFSNFRSKKLSFDDLRKYKPKASETAASQSNSSDSYNDGLIVARHSSNPIISERKSYPNLSCDAVVHQAISQGESYSVPNGRTKHNETIKESIFQVNPCHEVISTLTSYNSEAFETVIAFCRSMDPKVDSFGDTFKNYAEYRGTLLPLMMLELFCEIELEFKNSEIHNFLTVAVNDKNIEKRGESRRMVFHCQVDSLIQSQSLHEGHLVFARCECRLKNIEFLAVITNIAFIKKADDRRLAHFTLETSAITEMLPIDSIQVRPITVISNTLNAVRMIYGLDNSPLLNLILNPLSGQIPSKFNAAHVAYKGYDQLDTYQTSIIKALYKQCKNLDVPNISLLDGAAGTGKSCMISNLALQLVYGDSLPKPLRILICSRSNRNIDQITRKLLHVRNRTCSAQKIQLVRYGLLEQIDVACRCVSVQYMKENEQRFLQFANIDKLEKEKTILELKIRALLLDDENDNTAELKLWKSKLIKVDTLIGRLAAIDKNKIKDATTILLNACDIICTTLGSVTKLQNYIPNVDVCIIDEATQCNESLTLLPFKFGMSSLVLVGDSRIPPPMVYSPVANKKNYGKSLFSRFKKLFSGKPGSPIFRISIQHRMHPEILKWPNHYFYNDEIHPDASKRIDCFPINAYKIISYGPVPMESDNVTLLVNILQNHIDPKKYSIGIICTSFQQKSFLQNKLLSHQYISVNSADESHLVEKDVVIIWISKEYGMRHLSHQTLFNRAVTRARQCLLIFGADLLSYKSRSIWKSILEDAQARKCFHYMRNLLQPKLVNVLRKKSFNEQ